MAIKATTSNQYDKTIQLIKLHATGIKPTLQVQSMQQLSFHLLPKKSKMTQSQSDHDGNTWKKDGKEIV